METQCLQAPSVLWTSCEHAGRARRRQVPKRRRRPSAAAATSGVVFDYWRGLIRTILHFLSAVSILSSVMLIHGPRI